MYVRLAFSVAAHLNPEILIVDEVLAVGDATYQKRCMDHMSRIAHSGRSVLFVSHNMDLIPRLCEKAIRLERGRIVQAGDANTVVEGYLSELSGDCCNEDLSARSRVGDGRARFTHVWLIGPDGRPYPCHSSGEDLIIRVRIQSEHRIPDAALAINVMTMGGARVHSGWTREVGFHAMLDQGAQEYQCRFRSARLRPGQRMKIGLWLEGGSIVDDLEEAMVFEVADGHGTERYSTDGMQGVVLCDYEWERVDAASVPAGR
jgi:lipopolysaccharide transport system ATP-binding protein